jgi:hypothetical protein
MPEAWWQLRKLYSPVVAALTGRMVYCIEVCRVFDPQMPFNETPYLIDSLPGYVLDPDPAIGVFVWKP